MYTSRKIKPIRKLPFLNRSILKLRAALLTDNEAMGILPVCQASPISNRFLELPLCHFFAVSHTCIKRTFSVQSPSMNQHILTQSAGVQCLMFRTVCAIRHGCRWFQTETSCANLQRPCCKLPCEFYKKKFFIKHRFCLTHPPSVAVLNKNSQSKMYKDVYF